MGLIRDHFRKHGIIHLLWIIVLLVISLAALVVRSPGSGSIISLVSFASAIASLVLAMVAIFYAIVSNQSFSEAASNLSNSARDVLHAASGLDKNIQGYLVKSQGLLTAVEAVPKSVESLRDHFSEALENSAKAETSGAAGGDQGLFENITNAVAASLYILYLSAKHNKDFRSDDAFDIDYLEGVLSGVAGVLSYCKIDGIDVKRAGKTYQTRSIGVYSADDFELSYENIPEDIRWRLDKARRYFGEIEGIEEGGASDLGSSVIDEN